MKLILTDQLLTSYRLKHNPSDQLMIAADKRLIAADHLLLSTEHWPDKHCFGWQASQSTNFHIKLTLADQLPAKT